jgi:hypothetical protein
MSGPALRAALQAAGVRCDVEAEERLALLRPLGDMRAFADPALRRTVTRLALEHGFTHVALELPTAGAER